MTIRLSAILLLLFSCSTGIYASGGKLPIVIKGSIADSRTGYSIEGAEISIEKNGQTIYSVKSNDKGSFILKYEGQISRSDQLRISIYKSGYLLKTYKPLFMEDEEIQVSLDKKPRLSPIIAPARSGLHEL